MHEDEHDILLIDEADSPILIEDECAEFRPVLTDFIKVYSDNKDKPAEAWLGAKLQHALPEKTPEEIAETVREISETLERDRQNKQSLEKALAQGRSKESWFAAEVTKATSGMSGEQTAQYLNALDSAMEQANVSLYNTITTQAGGISQNPNLDGFIAEQHHAQTFNLNAAAAGSPYRAEVLEPTGKGYAKNSVDLVIKDAAGKIVRRYQSKYCKDALKTAEAFKHDNYRGQRKLVAHGQEGEITKASSVIEGPDGITSNPLTKEQAKQRQHEAQSGQWEELNWNAYKTKDLALGIGKQAGYASLQSAVVSIGFDTAQQLFTGEDIDADAVVENALRTGADTGLKAAAAGALKVCVEKEIISVIPKGTPAGTIANIANVGIENAKVLGRVGAGELTLTEGLEKMQETTVSTATGIMASGTGKTIGATIGGVFGPVGAAVGGFVGGSVGYMAGSKVGQAVVRGARKVCTGVKKAVKAVAKGVGKVVKGVGSAVKSICKGIAGFFGF